MRAGIVGVGFMSWIHYLAYQRSETAELAAFSSRDPGKRAGDWRGVKGNFGPPGEQIDISGLNVYETLDAMLEDETLDLIDICLPPSCIPRPSRNASLQANMYFVRSRLPWMRLLLRGLLTLLSPGN